VIQEERSVIWELMVSAIVRIKFVNAHRMSLPVYFVGKPYVMRGFEILLRTGNY
jgi:hypothetical protein